MTRSMAFDRKLRSLDPAGVAVTLLDDFCGRLVNFGIIGHE